MFVRDITQPVSLLVLGASGGLLLFLILLACRGTGRTMHVARGVLSFLSCGVGLFLIGALYSVAPISAELFVVALFLGLIPALIGNSKGGSFLAWWIFGTLLFILALPLALLQRPDQRAIDARKAADGMKACPYCAEMIRAEAIVCRYCGRDVAYVPRYP